MNAWTHTIFKHAYYGLIYQLYVEGLGFYHYVFNTAHQLACDCDQYYDCDCDDCKGCFCECEECTCACHMAYDCEEGWRHINFIAPLDNMDLWDAIKDDILGLSEQYMSELKKLPDFACKSSYYSGNYSEITREVM